jgi:hypothetical protein
LLAQAGEDKNMSQLELFPVKTEPVEAWAAKHRVRTECPYCEKERAEVNSFGSIDNEFDYSCAVCNLEYLNWREGEEKHTPYKNERMNKAFEVARETDRKNNEIAWKPHLKTIAERSEIFQPKGN